MSKIIAIETSNSISSVALSINGQCVAVREESGNENTHKLTIFVQDVLRTQGLSFDRDIDALAVSAGPGSYTGLRIGVATAKGICFASGKPLIAIGTVDAMCCSVIETHAEMIDRQTTLVGMIDARRMEIYTARYDYLGQRTTDVQAMVVDENSFSNLEPSKAIFFGSGALKCAELLGYRSIDTPLSARWLCKIAEEKFQNKEFEDIAYFEPEYIKEFVALTSSKKLF